MFGWRMSLQFSVYNFEFADVEKAWKHFELCEGECRALLEKYSALQNNNKDDGNKRGQTDASATEKQRFPLAWRLRSLPEVLTPF